MSIDYLFYIRPVESRSISYNSMYLILARVENFAATVTLNFYVYQSTNAVDDYRLVFLVSISLLRNILSGLSGLQSLSPIKTDSRCVVI